MHKDICPMIFYKQNGFTLPFPLSWLKVPWAAQGCFIPTLKRLLFRMSFTGLLLKAHCCLWAGWGNELNGVGTHGLETVQASAIRMPCIDLQVKQPHRPPLLLTVTQEESVKHSDCITKYWEMGNSEREIECSPLVVFTLERENKCVLPVWYFLCLELQASNNVFLAFSFEMAVKKKEWRAFAGRALKVICCLRSYERIKQIP